MVKPREAPIDEVSFPKDTVEGDKSPGNPHHFYYVTSWLELFLLHLFNCSYPTKATTTFLPHWFVSK